ncbi:hypothetical protein [Planctobacterium marinum]|uniref:hypothetical protein n=1 Tax=Planctobacterium marinum TaxID=1631968 RepID=UPI001E3C0A6A|nr:hypothetical protein [Planctobacterium marinum]MCC2604105.1 hypothetical protein [Planctobacterium marinum]
MKKSKYLLLSALIACFFAVFASAEEKGSDLVTTNTFCIFGICFETRGSGGGWKPPTD